MDGVFCSSGRRLVAIGAFLDQSRRQPGHRQFFCMIAYLIFALALGHLLDAWMNAEERARHGAAILWPCAHADRA
jgi:cytochrome c oxidase assembly protein subunit 15